jgi:hypothetical protein
MAEKMLHYETGFGVYRSTQPGHIPFFFITISVGWPKYSWVVGYISSVKYEIECEYGFDSVSRYFIIALL